LQHIFISYSRADKAWVRRLVEQLERRRLTAWLDQKDIPVSVPWAVEIEDAIEEAALFLRCDSAAFRRSANCALEVGVAEQSAKPQLVVTVGDDVVDCAGVIAESFAQISPERMRRTELRVLSRDWDRAGRPRNSLVSRGSQRRLARGLQLPPAETEPEQSFLQASKSRTRRRALVTTVLVTLIATTFATTEVLSADRGRVNAENSQEAIAYNQDQTGLEGVSQDPYRGLQIAAQDGASEVETNADVVSAALAEPTPDNAFEVPHAQGFAVTPVVGRVIVRAAGGREWVHSANADVGRPAAPLWPRVPATRSADGLAVRSSSRSGLVQVLKDGRLWRVITFDAVPQAFAFSPDGRFLAASIGEQVEIADVSSGEVRIHLRGATGRLLDVAWSRDGEHVWALSSDTVFSWLIGPSVTLVDQHGADYNSVLPAASPRAVWIVGTHALTEISVATGAVLASKQIDDTLYSAGGTSDGSLALVSGQRFLWVVPLVGRSAPRHVRLPGCSLGRPTFSDDSVAYVPCLGGDLLTLSMPSARVVRRVSVSSDDLFGATAVPNTGLVYAGDEAGYLYLVQGQRVVRLFGSECDAEVTRIAVAPGDRAVLPVGSGSGFGPCTKVGLLGPRNPGDPASWNWNVVLEPQEQSIFASAVSFSSRGGSFAIGYSNGTITMHPTVNIWPALVVNTADGTIRDMLTLPDGELIIVTDTGMVQRLYLCNTCLSDAALSKVAGARLRLAVRLGLAVQRPS
jgi:hypothetical protein